MLKALVVTGLLALFVGVQLVQSLDCYYCVASGTNCTNVKVVTCNQTIANETSTLLKRFQTVPNVVSNNFECIWFNHTLIYNEQTTLTQIRSCAYQEINACSKRSREFVGNLYSCMSCNRNLCNRSPAATFSPSLLTLPIVALCLIAKKFFCS